MNREELKNLTRRLRDSQPPPAAIPIPLGLEDRLLADVPVMLKPARRSRRALVIAGGMLAAAAAVVVAVMIPRPDAIVHSREGEGPTESLVAKTEDDATARESVAALREEVDRLRSELQQTRVLVERLEARDRRAKAEFAIQRHQSNAALERELAATILVLQGDFQRSRGESGAAEYRKAIELFADTAAAAKAKAKLNET